MIRYSEQEVTEEDILEVVKVLRSKFLTQGPTVLEFERLVASYCGAKYSVAVNSSTSALHIACLALGLGSGDLLWTSANTFVASANCGIYCGAEVDFVDIDPRTYNMSVEALSQKLKLAKEKQKLPKIVVPVHFAGQPCDMLSIYNLSKKYNFKIIEDASHALGALYDRFKVGSCAHSDVTVFSFHPLKIITTAEGGMALTKDKNIMDKMSRLRTHGITNDQEIMKYRPKDEIWNYQQIEIGFNYRMNEIQAALGLSQMKRIDKSNKRRREIAKNYDLALKDLPITIPFQSPNVYSSYHLYPIIIKSGKGLKSQMEVYNELIKKNILVNIHYIPVHRQPYYENLGFLEGDFPVAEKLHKQVISIPVHPKIKDEEQEYIVESLNNIIKP